MTCENGVQKCSINLLLQLLEDFINLTLRNVPHSIVAKTSSGLSEWTLNASHSYLGRSLCLLIKIFIGKSWEKGKLCFNL